MSGMFTHQRTPNCHSMPRGWRLLLDGDQCHSLPLRRHKGRLTYHRRRNLVQSHLASVALGESSTGLHHRTRTLVQFQHLGRTCAAHNNCRSITLGRRRAGRPRRTLRARRLDACRRDDDLWMEKASIKEQTFLTARATYIYPRIFWDDLWHDDYLRLLFVGRW